MSRMFFEVLSKHEFKSGLKKIAIFPVVVAHVYSPRTLEGEAGGHKELED